MAGEWGGGEAQNFIAKRELGDDFSQQLSIVSGNVHGKERVPQNLIMLEIGLACLNKKREDPVEEEETTLREEKE